MLSKAGFGVQVNGTFGPTTRKQLEAFQQSAGIERNGKLGPATLKALEASQNGASALGRKLASIARSIAQSRNTVGHCYEGVAQAIDRIVPPFLSGGHAYMAAPQLAAHPRFKEIPALKNMNSLPEGAVVVWGKGSSRSGHISIAIGKGQEASDHIAPQMQSHYGGARARVFLPQ
ncbi:MAG: peptidoglycan-binding protein [Candidatus Sericytochromatia bacterium]|nr:peptidoglycan-binding protein [Candidatus Sericytochromatia bacterium]